MIQIDTCKYDADIEHVYPPRWKTIVQFADAVIRVVGHDVGLTFNWHRGGQGLLYLFEQGRLHHLRCWAQGLDKQAQVVEHEQQYHDKKCIDGKHYPEQTIRHFKPWSCGCCGISSHGYGRECKQTAKGYQSGQSVGIPTVFPDRTVRCQALGNAGYRPDKHEQQHCESGQHIEDERVICAHHIAPWRCEILLCRLCENCNWRCHHGEHQAGYTLFGCAFHRFSVLQIVDMSIFHG